MNIIDEESFRGVHEGKPTNLYTLKNKNGLITQITNYGAIIVSIFVPDRNGTPGDIVQGYDTIEEYINGNGPFMGAPAAAVPTGSPEETLLSMVTDIPWP